MQVKGKIFPYPVINQNRIYSNYGERAFELRYDAVEENDNNYILKNALFYTDSQYINELYEAGNIAVYVIVECSDTVYRRAIPLPRDGRDINLRKVDFSERVDISMMAVATKSFTYISPEFDEEYADIEFAVEKNDIIAANDGFNIYFRHDEKEDSFASSIFTIIANHDFEPGAYKVECNTGKKIVITMADEDHLNYKVIYAMPIYQEVFFNMLLIPALIEGLSLCKAYLNESSDRDLDDVGNNFLWFRTICDSYKKLKGIELTVDDFKACSPVSLSQELLGKPIGVSLSKLMKDASHRMDGEDNE